MKTQTSKDNDSFFVSEEQTAIRIDRLLPTVYPGYSRNYFQFLIENGSVLVNGHSLKKRELLKVGDEVEVAFLLTPEISLEPENIPLDILYEDEHIIAVNKPAGMVIYPAPGHPNGTFVNALLYHCKHLPVGQDQLRPGIVHRLDKGTSGVLLAAKTMEGHRGLISLFSERKIEKNYVAVCIGSPPQGLLSASIGRHPVHRQKMAVIDEGREALTEFNVVGKKDNLSVVEAKLITGRTHQIRVHLKYLNTHILGDPVYGLPDWNKKFDTERPLLHAHRISFEHPLTKERLEIIAPYPLDLLHFTKSIID